METELEKRLYEAAHTRTYLGGIAARNVYEFLHSIQREELVEDASIVEYIGELYKAAFEHVETKPLFQVPVPSED